MAIILLVLDLLLLSYACTMPREDTALDATLVEQVQTHCIPAEDLERLKRSLEQGGKP